MPDNLCNIEVFAQRFIRKRWIDRFCHEYKKRPSDFVDRCTCNHTDLFVSGSLNVDRSAKISKTEPVLVIDRDGDHENVSWEYFLNSYPKYHHGFIAIAVSGEFGYLETHEEYEKEAKEYFIYKT